MLTVLLFSFAIAMALTLGIIMSKYFPALSMAFYLSIVVLLYAWVISDNLSGSYLARLVMAVIGGGLGVHGGVLVARELLGAEG